VAFSSMLKHLREERHLSQKDIADYLGITRQAVASYELAKREPDYDVLRKLADYFGVSIDYLLGRANCRDVNALTVGSNIELLRGNMTFKEMSEDISKRTGALIFPEMLELYCRGERMPFIGTLKILSKYAGVHESFFYVHNTLETYYKERELYKKEEEQVVASNAPEVPSSFLSFMSHDLRQWTLKEENVMYIKLAKDLQEAGITVGVLEPLIGVIKNNKKANEGK
jgi:transcriptional regulator with XRE-family HTH domain